MNPASRTGGPAGPLAAAKVGSLVAAGSVAIALGAVVSVPVPGSMVPQTAQTLAVVLAGGLLGARRGVAAVLVYLTLGILGLPIFAGGEAGMARLLGPTAGYLVGFVVAAGSVGVAGDRGWLERWLPALGVMIVAHALILALGWGWLSRSLGPGEAMRAGVSPFLVGGLLKAALGAAVMVAFHRGMFRDGPVAGRA